MNMIEKVARAISKAYAEDEKYWEAHKDVAKVVIEVMREPSEEMISGGLIPTAMWRDIKGSALTVNRAKMKLRYEAMIDAALKE